LGSAAIIGIVLLAGGLLVLGGYLFWRYVWFFRNPKRVIPGGENIVSPADGTVVYAMKVGPGDPVISIKNKRSLSVNDIVREDLSRTKLLVGIFMSPFNVHYNRCPVGGFVEFIKHHEPVYKNYHMQSMHWRSLLKKLPIYINSSHILSNERTVTKISSLFRGKAVSCYVVQIAGGSVRGIDSYVSPGQSVEKGSILGMIRIGSQVDMVVTWEESMDLMVKEGDKVRAGETILVQ
jgi:phosphatidylserine decarboxylase